MRRADQKLYKFIEGDFPRLHLKDIEDMLLLVALNKLNNLDGNVIVHLAVGLRIDGTLTSVRNTLDQMLKNLRLGYYKDMKKSKWTTTYQKRTRIMVKDINQQLLHRRIMRSLEKFVGGRDYGNDYRLLQRTNQRDLPRDILLDRIEVLRYDTKGVKMRKWENADEDRASTRTNPTSMFSQEINEVQGKGYIGGRYFIIAPKKRTTRSSPATTTTTTHVTNAQLKALIDQGVADALEARDTDRSMNGNDSHDSRTGVRRQAPFARECTYSDFMKCKPLYFKGTVGFVELTQCALTWWNSHVGTVGHDVAYAMTWTNLKKMMTDKYFPRGEIKKLEVEMWNLKVKGTDVVSYNQRFQELALMCARMFPEESDKIERYVGGLPDMIHGSVMASKPKTMQDEIEFATELMDKKISTLVERQAENKRKLDNNNQAQQQPPKKLGVAIAYTVGPGERKEYAGTLPLCNKCKFHHNGQCTIKCANCKRVGHLTQDCRSHAATNNQRNPTCYECGNQGHYRSDCLELKNQNHGNQAGGTGVREWCMP
ncbi:reverse transcriptase domain-containing protein [Tanacetum coccineum]